jgi:SAM-dependent methyltransferase
VKRCGAYRIVDIERRSFDAFAQMNLNEWQSNWDELGKDDPLWVVLTDPNKKGGKWDPKEFFATGEKEIDEQVLDYLKTRNIPVNRGVALDFGCGVGRLTQGLARHFEKVHGVDISPSMVEHARKFNRFGDKVQYHVNASNRLEGFADSSVDFVYSNIALQHIEPQFTKVYLSEFVRVMKPGGIALFQLLEATLLRRLVPQTLVDTYRKFKHKEKAFFGMWGIPEKEVTTLLRSAGAEIVDVRRTPFTKRWFICWFCIRKRS